MKTPLFSVNTYTDDVILSDTRVNMNYNIQIIEFFEIYTMLRLQIDKSIQLNLCLGGCRKYIERKRVTLIRIKKFYKIFQ